MKRAKPWAHALIVLTACVVVAKPALEWRRADSAAIAPTLDGFTARLDERMPKLMKAYSVPGVSVALIQGGKVSWTEAYGYADPNRGRPMTTDTLMMAQSISKSVTAWGVMKLVEERRVGLDDPVTRHIKSWRFPESEFPEERVTVRQLLSLSAGMPLGDFAAQYAPEAVTPSLEKALSGKNARLVRTPGSAFSYSNTSYGLLELLVEEVTGKDFAQYMKEEVLVPLGMTDSSFAWRREFGARIATGHDLKGRPVPAYVYPYRASGGLFTTVEDLARFVSASITNDQEPAGRGVLKESSMQRLYAPNVTVSGIYGFVADEYGLGHFLETSPVGRRAVWHGGQGNGWMTHFHLVPETGEGIVILTNSQRSWPLFSHVLRDWAKWSGLSSVGMANVSRAEAWLQVLVGLLLLASLWQLWRLGQGVLSGERRFAPLAPQARLLRLGQLALFAVSAGSVLWSVRQDYLFLIPLFPVLSNWLGVSLSSVALVSLSSACLPRKTLTLEGLPEIATNTGP